MEDTQMPEPLRQAVHQLVSEAVMNCQEVLRYTEPDIARDWKRMTLIRATDASDTMDMASMLIAAYCQRTGMAMDGRPIAVTGSGSGSGSGSDDQTVRVWDLTTREQVGEPLNGHTGKVWAVATGITDGCPIAVTGSWDKSVRVWDLTTGQPVGEPLTGHTDDVRAVATGVADGRPIAVTGSDDGTVRVWDLTTHRQTGPALTFPAPIEAVAVTPHNTHLTVVFGHDIAALSPH